MMWYVMIPSLAGTAFGVVVDSVLPYLWNNIYLGNSYSRPANTVDQRIHFIRDFRLSGYKSPFKQVGLENLD